MARAKTIREAKKVAAIIKTGLTDGEAGIRLGLTRSQVAHRRLVLGIPANHINAKGRETRKKVSKLRSEGKSLSEIGIILGLSRQAVHDLVQRAGSERR